MPPIWRQPLALAAAAFAVCGAAEVRAEGLGFEPRGRIQIDVQSRDWAVRDEDDADIYIRRLFLGVQGRIAGPWRYRADFVLTPGSDTIGVDEAHLEYAGEGWSLFIGENKVTAPFGERTSSLDVPFAERPTLIGAFGYGGRAGVGVLVKGEHWGAALALHGGSMNGAEGEGDVDETRALSTRLTRALIHDAEAGRVLHLGFHARHRYQNDAPQRVRARPLNGRDSRWIDAGSQSANRFEHDTTLGVEAAYAQGPLSFAAEFMRMEGQTPGVAEAQFSGFYLDVSWSLTGEARPYRADTGVFAAITPRAPVDEGGWGHWALSGRYEMTDLSDGADPERGEQQAYALGLDWIPVEHVRVKLNYAHSEMDRTIGPDDEADIATLRLQLDF